MKRCKDCGHIQDEHDEPFCNERCEKCGSKDLEDFNPDIDAIDYNKAKERGDICMEDDPNNWIGPDDNGCND